MVSPNDGAVDHLDAVWHRLALVERGEDQLPQPRQRPAPELTENREPFAEFFRQVTPRRPGARDPEDAIQNQPMIRRGSPSRPLIAVMNASKNTHSSSDIKFRAKITSTAKVILNQILTLLGIPFVNRT